MKALLLLVTFAALTMVLPRSYARDKGFLDRAVKVGGVEYRYQVFVPADWDKHRKWPIILFLHGAGERGSDGLQQTQVGLGTAIRMLDGWREFVIVMPQCRKDAWWPDPHMEDQALAALEAATKEFHGDRDRVYLTGLSMGGYGSWDIAAKHPGKFAAIAVICGGIRAPRPDSTLQTQLGKSDPDPYADTARRIGKTPVWVFHGDADPTVPVEESRRMVAALKAAGGDVRYTEYTGVGHNSWDRAYAEQELPGWLLQHTLHK
jgi:predicted peptidase